MTNSGQEISKRYTPASPTSSVPLLHYIRRTLASAHDSTDTGSVLCSLSTALSTLARRTRAARLLTFSSITLHVLEQVQPMARAAYLPQPMHYAMLTWINLSLAYLHKPASETRALALVEHLGHRDWERPIGRAHRDALFASLRHDVDCQAQP